jgi:hypothetical protein
MIINPAASVGAEAYQNQVSASIARSKDVQRTDIRTDNQSARDTTNFNKSKDSTRGDAVVVTLSSEARRSLDEPDLELRDKSRAANENTIGVADQRRGLNSTVQSGQNSPGQVSSGPTAALAGNANAELTRPTDELHDPNDPQRVQENRSDAAAGRTEQAEARNVAVEKKQDKVDQAEIKADDRKQVDAQQVEREEAVVVERVVRSGAQLDVSI